MNHLLSSLPQVDKLLSHSALSEYAHYPFLKTIIQRHLESIRQQILCPKPVSIETQSPLNNVQEIPSLDSLALQIQEEMKRLITPSLKPLLNATGIVLQTNLGRSIFSPKMMQRVLPLLCEYLNLEYDVAQGKRGERYSHLSSLLCAMFDCEDALVVNNNAAAVMLIVNTLAKDREIIISRGELIEIGGSFRIPEVIKGSGGKLREVGASNKTHLYDYENAICDESAIIAKIHKSNFAQIGFCDEVDFEDLILLARKHNLIDYFDLGSGFIQGFKTLEPSILDIMKLKPSLISFSGDKLLGSTQAGIILGKKELISKLKKNHLLRALRIDKTSLLILQETLLAYLNQDYDLIPTILQLSQDEKTLQNRANKLLAMLQETIPHLQSRIVKSKAKAGGGSLPLQDFPSYAIAIEIQDAQNFSHCLRLCGIIPRVQQNQIHLDIFCLQERHLDPVIQTIKNAISMLQNNA